VTDETHDEKTRMSFMDHLMELRARLVWSIVAVTVGLAMTAVFVRPILDVLRVPIERFREAHPEAPAVFRSPPVTAGFSAVLSVCIFGGLVLAMPFVLYQVWLFVRPALKRGERKVVVPFVAFGTILFLGGALVAYSFVTDAAINFLFAMNRLVGSEQTCGAGEYLRFVVALMLGFGLGFQLPLVMLVLSWAGVASAAGFRAKRRPAIALAFVFGAILTPPDVPSQILMAACLLALYELGALLSALVERRRARPDADGKNAAPIAD